MTTTVNPEALVEVPAVPVLDQPVGIQTRLGYLTVDTFVEAYRHTGMRPVASVYQNHQGDGCALGALGRWRKLSYQVLEERLGYHFIVAFTAGFDAGLADMHHYMSEEKMLGVRVRRAVERVFGPLA